MRNLNYHPKIENPAQTSQRFVSAAYLAKRYGVSDRHILNLAYRGTIPSIRVGHKCVRFDFQKVVVALEGDLASSASDSPKGGTNR